MTTNPQSKTYIITGMDCAECASTVQKGVSSLDGVTSARVDLATSKLHLIGEVPLDRLEQRVKALGYGLEANAPIVPKKALRGGVLGFWDYLVSRRETQLALIGGALILATLLATALHIPVLVQDSMLVVALATAGFPIARSGVRALFINRDFNINLLMTIAAVGALLIGQPLEGAVVIFLFAIGESLEGYTADRARDSLRSLMDIAPQTANVIAADGGESVLPVEHLAIDDRIRVKPGERIPMDGVVQLGESDVNQAPITGESVPVYKAPGAEVFAGTVNGGGMLTIRVTRLSADNTLSRIIHLVEEASSVRAPSQRLIDQFARVYTPAVVIIATLVALVPPIFFGAPFLDVLGTPHGWLYRALSMLVIACPCALVISAPVTVISAITRAARRGVLIKGGAYLEALGGVRAVAFDKTGTLTHGRPVITLSRAIDCETGQDCALCDDVLALAYAVEQGSTHPLAKAVVAAAEARGVAGNYVPAQTVEALAGRGVRGLVNGKSVTVGSHSLFDAEHPHNAAFCTLVNDLEQQGQTAMLLCDGDRVRGVIGAADAVRDDSKTVLDDLHRLGLKTVMLTGDNQAAADSVGRSVGIDQVRAGLLPADKLSAIQSMIRDGGSVAMVGDGINDTPALAAATVGIAMGGAGSAQALETADVALMADDLSQLPFAVRLSRFARSLIRQNIVLSVGLKALFLVLAVEGGASLWAAILADVGMSLAVTLNGMRPLRFE